MGEKWTEHSVVSTIAWAQVSMDNTVASTHFSGNDLGCRHPPFGKSNCLGVGEVFADFVTPVSVHVECDCTRSAFVQPPRVVDVKSEVVEEDGDPEGVLKV